MARLTQEAPQVSSVGIGNQQVVQNTSPTMGDIFAQGIKGTENMVNVAASMYAENQAESIVNASIEDIEAAQGAVQDWMEVPESFRAAEVNREGLNVDDSEFKLIEAAVRSGGMTRDRARLIASSRLKARIAEAPFAAEQLRQAASNIVGFNIQSEPARQYFAAFPERGSSSSQTALQKLQDEAQAISTLTGAPIDYVMGQMGQRELAKLNQEATNELAQLGLITSAEAASRFHQDDAKSAIGDIFVEIARAREAGETIDNVLVGNAIRMRKELSLRNFDAAYTAAGGIIGSEDYQRQRKTFDDRYNGFNDMIEAVGFDNLTQIGLDRVNRWIEGEAQENFSDLMILSRGAGQQVAADLVALKTNTNPTQLQSLIQRNPVLGRAFEFMDSDYDVFRQKMNSVSTQVFTGGDVAPEDELLADGIRAQEFATGSEEGRQHIFKLLADEGREIKALSLSTTRRAAAASEDERNLYKLEYENNVPAYLTNIGTILARANAEAAPRLDRSTFRFDSQRRAAEANGVYSIRQSPNGRLVVDVNAPNFVDPSTTEEIKLQVERLNMFTRSMDKGWGSVVNTNKQEWLTRVNTDIEAARSSAEEDYVSARETEQVNTEIDRLVEELRGLHSSAPTTYRQPFEAIQAEADRRASGGM